MFWILFVANIVWVLHQGKTTGAFRRASEWPKAGGTPSMKVFKRILAGSLVAALGTVMFGYRKESAAVAEAESQLLELRRRSEQLAPITERIEAYQETLQLLEQKVHVIQALQSPWPNNALSGNILGQFSFAMPSSVELERLLVQGRSLGASGRADAADSLERWGQSLVDEGPLSEFDLRRFEPSTADSSSGEFTLAGKLRPPPPPPPEPDKAGDTAESAGTEAESESGVR